MFRPNSIRGLLEKRDENKVSQPPSEQQPASSTSPQSTFDPEVEHIVEIKCTIKDVNNTINNIREWREEQRKNLEKSLQMNNELFSRNAGEERESMQERIEKEREEERIKFQNRMNQQQRNLEQVMRGSEETEEKYLKEHESVWMTEMITDKVEERERRTKKMMEKSQGDSLGESDQNQAFIESLKQMNQIFHKNPHPAAEESPSTPVLTTPPKPIINQTQIKSDLDQIQKQLQELEQLLK